MITLTREEAQQVLGVLEQENSIYAETDGDEGSDALIPVIEMLRARLAQPEPEPVAWMYEYGTDHGDAVNQIFWHKNLRLEKPDGMVRNVVPLYTAPPRSEPKKLLLIPALMEQAGWVRKREWQGLTDEEIKDILDCGRPNLVNIKKAEQKLKEKNG